MIVNYASDRGTVTWIPQGGNRVQFLLKMVASGWNSRTTTYIVYSYVFEVHGFNCKIFGITILHLKKSSILFELSECHDTFDCFINIWQRDQSIWFFFKTFNFVRLRFKFRDAFRDVNGPYVDGKTHNFGQRLDYIFLERCFVGMKMHSKFMGGAGKIRWPLTLPPSKWYHQSLVFFT